MIRKVKLIKLSDDEFDGNHPNDMNVGYTKCGIINKLPTVGKRFCIGFFSTSIVLKKLNKNGIFKTLFSTYKLEFLNKDNK